MNPYESFFHLFFIDALDLLEVKSLHHKGGALHHHITNLLETCCNRNNSCGSDSVVDQHPPFGHYCFGEMITRAVRLIVGGYMLAVAN